MSQFWYSDETATQLAEEVIREAGEGGRYKNTHKTVFLDQWRTTQCSNK